MPDKLQQILMNRQLNIPEIDPAQEAFKQQMQGRVIVNNPQTPLVQPMHMHMKNFKPGYLFSSGVPEEEGQSQDALAAIIDKIRAAFQKPTNWDPRDVNLPLEKK